jgi:hypothetical protein
MKPCKSKLLPVNSLIFFKNVCYLVFFNVSAYFYEGITLLTNSGYGFDLTSCYRASGCYATVAPDLGSIPAFSDTMESEGAADKAVLTNEHKKKKSKKSPFNSKHPSLREPFPEKAAIFKTLITHL